MHFGFKNTEASYQRAMVSMFHDMIHDLVEVYVDDILAKSRRKDYHFSNLRKKFQQMREFKLKLNPQKCAFGVSLGKLLRFIVSRREIEVHPKKVLDFFDMPSP